MKQKTYGVSGLLDWKTEIRVGRARVVVHFTGGALTSYGVTPAEYSTTDLVLQHIIEDSEYYKRGKIRLLRSIELAETAGADAPGTVAQSGRAEEAQEEDAGTEVSGDGLKEVEVTCLQDALDYLKTNYNIGTTKVRSYEQAQKAGSEHGVRFVGDKF